MFYESEKTEIFMLQIYNPPSHKMLRFFVFIFFNFNSSFFQNISYCNIPLGLAFQPHEIYKILLNVQKVTMARKISAINKKSYCKYPFPTYF